MCFSLIAQHFYQRLIFYSLADLIKKLLFCNAFFLFLAHCMCANDTNTVVLQLKAKGGTLGGRHGLDRKSLSNERKKRCWKNALEK